MHILELWLTMKLQVFLFLDLDGKPNISSRPLRLFSWLTDL
jgi:hypothetical protein